MFINREYIKLPTAETISGTRAVSLNTSGQLQIAGANSSTRMPAIGVVIDNVVSGSVARAYFEQNAVVSISGSVGKAVFVGNSGELIATSGGLLSGAVSQQIGYTYTSGAALRF